MNIWTDEISKDGLSLTVMLVLAVALIAGQARATFEPEARSSDVPVTELQLRFRTDSEQSDAPSIDAMVRLPLDVSFNVRDFSVDTDISIGSSGEGNREHTPIQ